jgi:formate hydrogenlyase subunit 3/multisubunit Na+/H+ antiporter MnhD subunit
MTAVLLALTILTPLVLAALPGARRLAPWAAGPGLALAALGEVGSELKLPWLLLGTQLGLDETGRVFLLVTALLWLLAGLYGHFYGQNDSRQQRYLGFWLLTLAGNLGVILAHDIVTFYLCFALMTLAAFGLVVHRANPEAHRAGRVYLVMSLLGEGLILAGLLAAVMDVGGLLLPTLAGVSLGAVSSLLLAIGFGVKVGVVTIHMWLPLAHPIAPTPASAVLSGAMIKAGLLGWLRFLPLGEAALPAVGGLLAALGLIGAFYAALVGFMQREAKTVLAYSSVSQMGLVTLAVGLALVSPQLWPAASLVTLAFVMHHGLVKGALFLGMGVGPRSVVLVGLSLAALAMIGLPVTGGALVKSLLKEVVGGGWLELLVSLSATGTTLLMLRVLVLVGRQPTAATPTLPFWLVSLVAALIALPLWAYAAGWPLTEHLGLSLDKAWALVWPGLLGLALFTALGGFGRLRFWLPPGDLLVGLELLWHRFRPEVRPASVAKVSHPKPVPSLTWLDRLEVRQRRWDNVGLLFLSLGALLILIMLGGNGG